MKNGMKKSLAFQGTIKLIQLPMIIFSFSRKDMCWLDHSFEIIGFSLLHVLW